VAESNEGHLKLRHSLKLINNEDKIFEVLNGTIATIEIVLAEFNS